MKKGRREQWRKKSPRFLSFFKLKRYVQSRAKMRIDRTKACEELTELASICNNFVIILWQAFF